MNISNIVKSKLSVMGYTNILVKDFQISYDEGELTYVLIYIINADDKDLLAEIKIIEDGIALEIREFEEDSYEYITSILIQ